MDNSNTQKHTHSAALTDKNTSCLKPLGSISANEQGLHQSKQSRSQQDQKSREHHGQTVALAMALAQYERRKQRKTPPTKGNALPSDIASIRLRLTALSQEITSQHADLLELLVRFDDLQGWKLSGAKHCAAWMNAEIGIGLSSAWEYLRVGRKLQTLPILRKLFRVGKISWSKVRLISRVADETNETDLCHAALDASVSDIKRLCQNYHWSDDDNNESDQEGENRQAINQWQARSFSWHEATNGNTRIQITLPPEQAQAFLNSIEHAVNQLESSECDMSQRRADAALLIAERSLQNAGKDIATADRYQVIVTVDESELTCSEKQRSAAAETSAALTTPNTNTTRKTPPTKRPTLQGSGPIANETARRLACDCHYSVVHSENGEPTSIGRKSRIWSTAMARAIKHRDETCVWPGCTQSRHLHIHHIKHWADGGETAVHNGACLCSHHHTLVHEGGYTIVRADDNAQQIQAQFVQQLNAVDIHQFDVEKALRCNKDSFNNVRALMPSRYRFRVLDPSGGAVGAYNYAIKISSNDDQISEGKIPDYNSTRIESPDSIEGSALNCNVI